ncbi:MAG: HPr family phosphocarrier protein [Gammaproteobacteria bacterium]|nr:HPr family phosphocarrier protein [Gammaproteobacteria bacterium]MDH5736455.1 HPr family phosphocarrier protein [Gammaproteobacteria bacterium]
MPEISRTIEIINKLGMHARAAAKFVNLASSFHSLVQVEKNGQKVDGKSIMGVMMLAAAKGSEITLHIDGNDAETCITALEKLVNNRFDENE